jgi:DNA/RNA endonuclease YhcR with UshA esterase domain
MTTRLHTGTHIFVLALGLGLFGAHLHAAVKTTSINKTDLGSINRGLVDSTVEVEATIKSITAPRAGSNAPVRIELTDATGAMNLVIWPDVYDVIKAQSPLAPGTIIHARAKVTNYKENLQLQVHTAADVKIAPKTEPEPSTPAPASTPVAAITSAMLDKDVTVQATITEIREPHSDKAPFIVTLAQDNARIPLVFWSDLQTQIKVQLKVGNVVRVKAQVTEHRGTLEIKLRNATDLTVVTAATPPATSP